MDTLTREEAIKRIRDIRARIQIDHLYREIRHEFTIEVIGDEYCIGGAIAELMAIFDIKEEELR